VSFVAIVGVALAQTYIPLAPLPIGEGGATPTTWTLTSYLSGMIKLLVALGGALAVLMLVIAGTQYVAAGINPSAKSTAKEHMMNAFIGLTLVLTSYLILNSINPKLVAFNLLLPPVGGVVPKVKAPVVVPGGQVPAPTQNTSNKPSLSGGANPKIPPPAAAPAISPGSAGESPATPLGTTESTQNVLNARINQNNDLALLTGCFTNSVLAVCAKTDLDGDGKTTNADLQIFLQKGGLLDVNRNRTIELENRAAVSSCFLKIPTADISGMLPRYDEYGEVCGGGSGRVVPPSVSCNGVTWIKASSLRSACAVTGGLSTMPFGSVYGGSGNFDHFHDWIAAAASGRGVDLTKLFSETFFPPQQGFESYFQQTQYIESDTGKITYATIAQYDLNNDGTADFSTSGGDMAGFAVCKDDTTSGAQVSGGADFNQDGAINCRDIAFAQFMQKHVLGGAKFIPLKWELNWFESLMFDPTGYSDKQILNYCLGRKSFGYCAIADVNGDRAIDGTDLSLFVKDGPILDFNGDGKVDLQ